MADRFTILSTTPGQVISRTSGAIGDRPVDPKAGDTYAVTSGAGLDDRYTCFTDGAWTLSAFNRTRLGELSPWAWWHCTETSGGVLVDSAGGVGDLTLGGTYTLSAPMGTVGRGLKVSLGGRGVGSGAAPTSTRKLSIACWIQIAAVGGLQCVVGRIGSWNSVYGSMVLNLSNGVMRGYVGCGGTVDPKTGVTVLALDIPHLMTIEWDGDAVNRLTMSLDGTVEYAGTPNGTADLVYALTSPAWQIGTNPSIENLAGTVREVQVYDGAVFTPAQRRELYARGVGLYEGV